MVMKNKDPINSVSISGNPKTKTILKAIDNTSASTKLAIGPARAINALSLLGFLRK